MSSLKSPFSINFPARNLRFLSFSYIFPVKPAQWSTSPSGAKSREASGTPMQPATRSSQRLGGHWMEAARNDPHDRQWIILDSLGLKNAENLGKTWGKPQNNAKSTSWSELLFIYFILNIAIWIYWEVLSGRSGKNWQLEKIFEVHP